MNKFVVFIVFSFLFLHLANAQENIPVAKRSEIAFADFLFNTQQYEFAAQEYLKLVYSQPHNTYLKKRTLESFRLNNDLNSGLYFSDHFFNQDPKNSEIFYREMIKIKLLAEKKLLNPDYNPGNFPTMSLYNESLLLDYMLGLDWDQVKSNADKIKNSPLYGFTKDTPENLYLKPFLAATFSTIIPGAGKVYAKRWKDGLSSFLFVGLTGFQAYRGFKKSGRESVYGWLMGGLSFSFYLGNIYGSHKAANDHNIRINEEYKNRVVNYYIHNY